MVSIDESFGFFVRGLHCLWLFESAQLLFLVEREEFFVVEEVKPFDVGQTIYTRFNYKVELLVLGS